MRYRYGEMFEKLGVPRMGHQGAPWCGVNPDGVLVMMSHENFYRKIGGHHFYIGLGHQNLPTSAPSSARSIRMIAEYYCASKPILLPIGVFKTDGGATDDGKNLAAKFLYATGRVANATMLYFDASTGTIACEVDAYFEL